MRTAGQMMTKAKMLSTLPDDHIVHFIYAYDPNKIRKYYPLESDYAATVMTNKKQDKILTETFKL